MKRFVKKVFDNIFLFMTQIGIVITFLLIPYCLYGIIRFGIIEFDFKRLIGVCLVLYVAVKTNKEL